MCSMKQAFKLAMRWLVLDDAKRWRRLLHMAKSHKSLEAAML